MFHHNDPVYYGLQTCFFDLSWQSSVRNSAALKGTLIWKLWGGGGGNDDSPTHNLAAMI